MRAIWKGAVSFGLVNVPVRLYSATENHDVSFRQVHREDGGRIKYQRICSIDGQQVSYDDIAKGYETEDGDMVVLTDEDFKDLPATSSKEIAVQKFVPAEQIDPMLLDKSYYLEPDKSATKPYILLRDALGQADRMAVVTVSIRTRMTMAVLRVKDGAIVMQTMLWPDEVRAADFASLDEDSHATGKELEMANMLIESLAGDYDPSEFEDDYAQAVEALVKASSRAARCGRRPRARTRRARSWICLPRWRSRSRRRRPPGARPRPRSRRQPRSPRRRRPRQRRRPPRRRPPRRPRRRRPRRRPAEVCRAGRTTPASGPRLRASSPS
jgi:DNA end-binding protein Ku